MAWNGRPITPRVFIRAGVSAFLVAVLVGVAFALASFDLSLNWFVLELVASGAAATAWFVARKRSSSRTALLGGIAAGLGSAALVMFVLLILIAIVAFPSQG